MENLILGLAMMVSTISASPQLWAGVTFVEKKQTLAVQTLDLTKRLPDEYGASVFADNILLSLRYLKGDISQIRQMGQINWNEARQPFTVEFILKPGEVFAFHDVVLPQFKPTVTMKTKFFIDEGYKELGGLGGNGVCHLASLINWAAKDAKLEVTALVNHDFYPVPGVPREYGVSIFSTDSRQNLYIKNNKDFPVLFEFFVNSRMVNLSLLKLSN